jgi:hypothetical protein
LLFYVSQPSGSDPADTHQVIDGGEGSELDQRRCSLLADVLDAH